jgi:hypothetical protein
MALGSPALRVGAFPHLCLLADALNILRGLQGCAAKRAPSMSSRKKTRLWGTIWLLDERTPSWLFGFRKYGALERAIFSAVLKMKVGGR